MGCKATMKDIRAQHTRQHQGLTCRYLKTARTLLQKRMNGQYRGHMQEHVTYRANERADTICNPNGSTVHGKTAVVVSLAQLTSLQNFHIRPLSRDKNPYIGLSQRHEGHTTGTTHAASFAYYTMHLNL